MNRENNPGADATAAAPPPTAGASDDGGFECLHHAVFHWAAHSPDAPALTESARTWTYAALAAQVEAAAQFLRTRDVRRGDRVMLVGENSGALACFILAASVVNACAVLENARRAPLEVDRIRQHCEPRLVIYLTGNSPDARAHAERAGARFTDAGGLGEVAWGACDEAAPPDPVDGSCRDVAVLIYTTGTTGEPKGVMLTHANLLFLASMMVRLRSMTPSDRVYVVLPITHVMGLAPVFGGALRAGAHLFVVPRFSVDSCAVTLEAAGITVMQGAPAMFAKLAEHARTRRVRAPRLRFIAAGGAPIDATVRQDTEALFGLTLHNGYGLTEASGLCWTRLEQPRQDDSVGVPLPGVELKVLDDQGRSVQGGRVGELWGRGPQVMKGYYRNPQQTTLVLREDGWFKTEDLARIDADGSVFIVGRTKDLIISGGFNVYPLEVENALNAHPSIVQSAVIGRSNGSSEEVVAFIEVAHGNGPGLADLLAFLAARISPYKRPREIYSMAQLPSSPNGKVLKSRLKQMLLAGDVEGASRLH